MQEIAEIKIIPEKIEKRSSIKLISLTTYYLFFFKSVNRLKAMNNILMFHFRTVHVPPLRLKVGLLPLKPITQFQ